MESPIAIAQFVKLIPAMPKKDLNPSEGIISNKTVIIADITKLIFNTLLLNSPLLNIDDDSFFKLYVWKSSTNTNDTKLIDVAPSGVSPRAYVAIINEPNVMRVVITALNIILNPVSPVNRLPPFFLGGLFITSGSGFSTPRPKATSVSETKLKYKMSAGVKYGFPKKDINATIIISSASDVPIKN